MTEDVCGDMLLADKHIFLLDRVGLTVAFLTVIFPLKTGPVCPVTSELGDICPKTEAVSSDLGRPLTVAK